MKANFKLSDDSKAISKEKSVESTTNRLTFKKTDDKQEITPEEFEDFIIKSGAVGSFMIFRSNKKEDEMGIEEL